MTYHKKQFSFEGLFSNIQRKILALLFIHDQQSFYTNEIIRFIRGGTGAVQRELKKLSESGLINIQQLGNQKRYQANQASPIFSEIKNIVIKTFGMADVLRNSLSPIANQIHIGFIYGSIAKQNATAQSDVDLMIISDTINYADVFSLLESVSIRLQRSVNPTIYSSAEWKRKLREGNNFLNRVFEQPKIYLIGNEDELKLLS